MLSMFDEVQNQSGFPKAISPRMLMPPSRLELCCMYSRHCNSGGSVVLKVMVKLVSESALGDSYTVVKACCFCAGNAGVSH